MRNGTAVDTRRSKGVDAYALPPHNLESELSVLSSILVDNAVLHMVIPILKSEDFYRDSHQVIFTSYLGMYERGIGIDGVSLREELRRASVFEKVGGEEIIDSLLRASLALPHTANARHHAYIVLEKSITRQLVQHADELRRDAYSGCYSGDQLLQSSERRLIEIAARAPSDQRGPIQRGALSAMERIAMRRQGLRGGILTGFTDLDDTTDGLYPGSLIVLAARPSMGKTAFALAISNNVATSGRGVLFISLEMQAEEIGERLIVSRSRISGHDVRQECDQLTEQQFARLGKAYNEIAALEHFILDDASSRTPSQIAAIIRQEMKQRELSLVVVDYLQLIEAGDGVSKRDNRQEAVAYVSRRLKAIAKETRVAVLAVAQLNRETAKRRGHRPRMSDLRESGQIEQDADLVMLLHRPDYYDAGKKAGIAELIIDKNRNGKTGIVDLVFLKDYATFANCSHDHGEPF